MASATLVDGPIEAALLIASVETPAFGAVVVFAGNVRNSSRGKRVVSMEYTAYRPLAETELRRIAGEAEERCRGKCALAHRLGVVPIGEASVFVAVAAGHRAEAFDACRWAIDEIKARVPIWKRESCDDGTYWIEGEQAVLAEPPQRDND